MIFQKKSEVKEKKLVKYRVLTPTERNIIKAHDVEISSSGFLVLATDEQGQIACYPPGGWYSIIECCDQGEPINTRVLFNK